MSFSDAYVSKLIEEMRWLQRKLDKRDAAARTVEVCLRDFAKAHDNPYFDSLADKLSEHDNG